MSRPVLDDRVTIRIPSALLADYLNRASRSNCSLNALILDALENEAARLLTYRLDYYTVLRPLVLEPKGDNGGQSQALSDDGRPSFSTRLSPDSM